MPLKVTEVFVPASYPQHTYVQRSGDMLEGTLRDAIDTPGQLVSLSGPSKSGKTVLVENVVGRDQLITITGASIKTPEDVWAKVLDWIEAPVSTTTTKSIEGSVGGDVTGSVGAGIPFLAKAEGTVGANAEVTAGGGTESIRERSGLQQAVRG